MADLFPIFQQTCHYSPEEVRLRHCFDDADQLCSYGCNNVTLKFCHYFNDFESPMRNCNEDADQQAEKTFNLILKHNLTLIDTKEQIWQILSCIVHLHPCLESNHQPMRVCKLNCQQILKNFINNNNTIQSEELYCKFLENVINGMQNEAKFLFNQNETESCIDLNKLINKNNKNLSLSNILDDNNNIISDNIQQKQSCECDDNQQCLINHDCFKNECPHYQCINVCLVGLYSLKKVI